MQVSERKHEVKNEVKTGLEVVLKLKEGYSTKVIVDFLMGKSSKEMNEYEFSKLEGYAAGVEKGEVFWYSILRQALLAGLLEKEIENYGVLKVTAQGKAYIKKPKSFKIPLNRDFSEEKMASDEVPAKMVALDEVLVAQLEDLRRKEAKKKVYLHGPYSRMYHCMKWPHTILSIWKNSRVSVGCPWARRKNTERRLSRLLKICGGQ